MAQQTKQKKKKSFWNPYNYIGTKMLLILFVSGILASISDMVLEDAEIPVFVLYILMFILLIWGIVVVTYLVTLLCVFLYGAFVVIPKSQHAKDILKADIRRRQKEDEIVNEYGTIDYWDKDDK